jgi:hypothetical protein
MAARVPPTLTEELRIQLGEIGWTPEMTCAVLDAADYDSRNFVEDIHLIYRLSKPKQVLWMWKDDPIRLREGCNCATCLEARIDGVASFIPNAQGRESYMPIDFLYHALKWNVDDVDAFFDKKRRSRRIREKRILSQ